MLKPKHKKEGRQTFQWSFFLMNKNTEARLLPETTLEGLKTQNIKTGKLSLATLFHLLE